MKPEDQKIAIAKASGWKWNHECDIGGKAFPECWTHDEHDMVFHDYELPDYLNDLNAMHEVEKVLDVDNRKNYASLLFQITAIKADPPYTESDRDGWFMHIHATAAQRAEAFLKTLNLSEDDPFNSHQDSI